MEAAPMLSPILADHAARGLRSKRVQLSTGPSIHYVEQGDPTDHPDAEPIIFVHGLADSWFSFSAVMAQLPATYPAFALDLRGFGDSERPESGYTIDQFAADVAAFMDAVGCGAATLVGHSLGSFIVRRVAQLYPTKARRLMLIGSAYAPVNPVTLDVYEIVHGLTEPISEEFVREFQGSTLHTPVPIAFFEGVIAESLKAPVRVWQSTLDGVFALNDTADLGRITVPTVIVWGDHDALFNDLDDQERLASAIPGARLSVYAGAGHSPNWEMPARIASDLTAFVSATRQ
jgi:non-heme chloroperoxidase